MHNHIDDELQSTKEVDGLYSYEVLTKGQKFLGYLILKGEWENFKEIRKIYNSMNNRVTSIGKGRNNGYGLSVIEFIESESCQLDNKRLYVERKLNFSDSNKFTLTLLSDLILKSKHHNSYYTYINEEVLCKILNDGRKEKLFEPVNFKLIRSFCRTKEIDGFNMHHGLPKNKMIGLTKGSSFLFKYNISDSQSLGQILLKVERNGLGLRRSEGYGMVAINLPYHKENLDK
jgi:CRISPR/Cas system CSM-associated protein Csm3 (group 7 of RAMP superfamily)